MIGLRWWRRVVCITKKSITLSLFVFKILLYNFEQQFIRVSYIQCYLKAMLTLERNMFSYYK